MLVRFGVTGPSILWHLIAVTTALPQPHYGVEQQYLSPQNEDSGDGWRKYVLPVFDATPSERADQIERNREGYLYGASLLGNTSYFPTGLLGDAMVKSDVDLWYEDAAWVSENVERESRLAAAAVSKGGGLQNLSSFGLLYDDQWELTMPTGIAPGAQTNYTQDLFFSMERLSVNPYVVERIHPESKELPFMVEDSVVSDLTNGMNLKALHAAGRLFFADHSYQAKYPKIKGKYAAACSAYFFIHPMTGDFLPLAIRTNVESDLIYTPLDAENDWLLAKMMFNMNDLFHGQIFHLANSHAVSEAVHQAALRTLSEMHPVRAFLDRIMYQAYAIRPVGEQVLFNPGGFFDQTFFLSNEAVRQFATEYYPVTAGAFQANYFHQDLISRGLISCSYGPALKSLPYYEDASAMVSTLSRFTESYLRVYYPSEDFLAPDHELQSWIVEASTAAKVLDFPNSPLISRDVLTSILVHVAYLNGVSHHSLNSGTPASTSGVLPFHPAALYAPPPKTKGTIDTLMPFLANMTDALGQITLLIRFNRPKLEEANGNLVHMFSGSNFLGYGSAAVTSAAKVFENEMLDISNRIMGRVFDERGLAQGMPFIWRSLDPRKIPFFLSV